MAWGKNGTPHTLSGNADLVEITDMTANKSGVILINRIPSGTARTQVMFNDDTISGSTDYSYKYSNNGGTDTGNPSTWGFQSGIADNTVPNFMIIYYFDISGEYKLFINFIVEQGTAGTGYLPSRREEVAKFVASERITKVHLRNDGSGDYVSGSNLSALGSELTPQTGGVTLQDGTIFEETDTNKAYIWSSSSETWTQL